MAEEFRGKGIHVLLGPGMDLMRNAKAGRGWENFGPDPYLNGEGAFATITGIERRRGGVREAPRREQPGALALRPQRARRRSHHARDWYPFLRGIEANVSTIVCADNQLNRTSSCHNAGLLGPTGLVRAAGFQGHVVSDWGATHDSVADNANAGLDMEQPGDWILIGGGVFGTGRGNLASAVNSGDVSTACINRMLARVLAPYYRLGQDSSYPAVNFDAQHPDGSGALNLGVSVRSAAHTALVREIGGASAVLLKNNRTVSGGVTTRGPPWGSGSNPLDFIVPPITTIQDFVSTFATISTSLSNDPVTATVPPVCTGS
ncbi:glycoside hydrolase superfamily [Mycena sp. CBHHK59/15]|nr:glycoside hydrolase superfamily [Mycena sp. CBHHK59/15]